MEWGGRQALISPNELMKLAVKSGASDIFITVGVVPTLKVNGDFIHINGEILKQRDTEEFVKSLLVDEVQYEKLLLKGERDFSFSIPGLGRFRVNAYKQRGSLAAAIRVLGHNMPNVIELGLPEPVLDICNKLRGLVLITGPTGSGKSTSLAAIIDMINQNRACHILTLEDPLEYLHKHSKSIVDQREIGDDTGSYAEALKSAMRQSPDVILVGEMRDLETISIALTAAETGHLVLSSLHTTGAAKTIDRIIDVFPSSQQQQIKLQLSTVLQAVISQQLIPSRIRGRAAAFEVMLVNNAIRNMIRDGKTTQIDSIIQTGRSQGMITMDASIIELCKTKIISKEDALLYCINPDIVLKNL